MAARAEYHICMRFRVPASFALFGLLMLPVLVLPGFAQINGAPASVTSPGFGGRAINGTPSSVTSLGPRGFAPQPHPGATRRHDHQDEGHRHHYVQYSAPLVYAVPLPYAVDIGDTDDNSDDNDPEYQGGPTVFDRRGSGADSYVPPVRDFPRPHAAQSADDDPPPPETPQPPTLLVFKDGHQLGIGNYAIVGANLFDLTPGHARRIAIVDLDLEATRRQNDDRGVTFQLPASPAAN